MPKAPISHKPASVGKSHTVEVAKKRINAMAYQRQKSRHYRTNSPEWQRIKNAHFSNNENAELCAECLKNGLVRTSKPNRRLDVDHIDGNDSNNDLSNLQSLCISCHSRKTATENGGFGNRKRR